MFWIKKLIKNKTVALAVCVIVVSLVYMGVQKAIDNYNFKANNDIVVEEADFTKGEVERGIIEKMDEGEIQDTPEESAKSEGEISEEETDLVLEESEGDATAGGEHNAYNVGEEIEEPNKIYVYVTGEVNIPGVVILNEGSRIADAINAAGGTTAKANVSKVNLVYVLEDGMKVNIPNNTDLKNNTDFEYITMNSGDGGRDDYTESSVGAGNTSTGGTTDSNSSSSGRRYDIVNINTATQTELETLPGIGPSLALNIINHRKENGKFSSIEQIKDVSGIGESKFETLKKYITI